MQEPNDGQAVADVHSGEAPRGAWNWLVSSVTTLTGILLAGALALVLYTVVLRFFAPSYAPDFTEEVTVYAVMWSVLLAGGQVSMKREHVCADLVVHTMPPHVQRWAAIAANLAGAVFSLFLIVYGGQVAYQSWDFGDLSMSSLRFPLWIYYACVPVASMLIGIGHLCVVVDLIRGRLRPVNQPAPVE